MRIYAEGVILRNTQCELTVSVDGIVNVWGCRYDIYNRTVTTESNTLMSQGMEHLGIKRAKTTCAERQVFKGFVVNNLTREFFVDFFNELFQVTPVLAHTVRFDIQPTPHGDGRLFVTADKQYYLVKAIKRNCPQGKKLIQEKKLKAQETLSLLNIYSKEEVLKAIETADTKWAKSNDSALDKAVFKLVIYLNINNLVKSGVSWEVYYKKMKKITVGQLQKHYLKAAVDKHYTHLVKFYADKPAEVIEERSYKDD